MEIETTRRPCTRLEVVCQGEVFVFAQNLNDFPVICWRCEGKRKELVYEFNQKIYDLKQEKFEIWNENLRLKDERMEVEDRVETEKRYLVVSKLLDRVRAKKEKLRRIKGELERVNSDLEKYAREVEEKTLKGFQEIREKYEKDMQSVYRENKDIKEELEKVSKLVKSEACKLATDITSKERKLFLIKLSKLSTSKNEANAKLEILRQELHSLHSFLFHVSQDETESLIDRCISSLEYSPSVPPDYLLPSLAQIKQDLNKLQLSEKLNRRLIEQKNSEIIDLKKSLQKPKQFKGSPHLSKVQTTNSSPTSSQTSFFRNFSPKHVPSYSFHEDTRQVPNDDRIISEFAGLKLKYALLQEFVITRDNEFRILFHELRKKDQRLEDLVEGLLRRLDQSSEFLD